MLVKSFRGAFPLFFIALAACGGGGAGHPQGTSAIQALPPLSASTSVRYRYIALPIGQPFALNSTDTAVGRTVFEIPNVAQMWKDGALVPLSLPAGFDSGVFVDINNAGVALGNGGTGSPHLYTYAHGHILFQAPDLGTAINNAGDIVGSRGSQVVVYPKNAQPFLPFNGTQYASSYAAAINNRGDYTGSFRLAGNTQPEAYLGHGTVIQDLNVAGYVTGINDAGVVVGFRFTGTGNVSTGFMWIPSRGLVPFPSFPNAFEMRPSAINNRGEVVGEWGGNGLGGPRGFLYSGGVLYDLAQITDREVTGTPVDINDRGDILMYPPELPGSFLLKRL